MVKINLLPKEAQKRAGVIGQIVLISLLALLSILAFVGGWVYLNNVIDGLRKDIRRLEARQQELAPVLAQIEQFKAEQKELKDKREAILKLEKDQKLPVRVLDELYKTLDKDVWLTALSKTGDKMSVSGLALSNPAISSYLRKLEESPFLKSVDLVISSETKVGDQSVRSFQINCEIERVEETQAQQTQEAKR
jgi:type IV pilus assembly protein PilN